MPRLALKIDVDTWRGTREGVPRLVELLHARQAQATFLFSLGRDHTGRAIKRVFRPGFLNKVGRTSVLSHYGILTLLYGTVLPGPDIGRRGREILRGVKEAGFEVGIHCWDHVKWQDGVVSADNAWVEKEITQACQRFEEVFGEQAKVHGAAGWQMNRHALRLTQRQGFNYSSDCRGSEPFLPLWDGELVNCPQLPTTLPTLDELIGVDGITENTVADHLLSLTAQQPGRDQVFTLHAELEGMKLAPVFEKLLDGWLAQGFQLVSLAQLAAGLVPQSLPRCPVTLGELPGRSGTLLLQGERLV